MYAPYLSLIPSSTADLTQTPRAPILHQYSPGPSRKRKRSEEAARAFQKQPPTQRPLVSSPNCISKERPASEISESNTDPLQYWIQNGRWREEYFQQDSQVREDFEKGRSSEEFEVRDWVHEHCIKEPFRPMHGFHHLQHLFARKKSSSSLRRKNSGSSLQTPSDQLPREVKSAQYRSPDYESVLESKGSFMDKSKLDITDNSKCLCRDLLRKDQTIPQGTLFRDDLFEKTCQMIRGRNETMVIRDIGLLLVPSAQTLATYGATHLDHLYESVNEGWNSAIPFHGTRPQPDYSVGFGRSAFSEEKLKKLEPFVGDILYGSGLTSYFMATTRMYFPFLTCEVKCGAAALDVADRQNAHSMTVAVKGVVELYKAVKREKELHREILAFSITHDHRSVRIYGHYAIIEEDNTTFYRHPIHTFDFTALDGKEKTTTNKFTRNVYDIFMPIQHRRICSAVDDLPPDIDFDLSQSASFPSSGVQSSQQSDIEDDGQSSLVGSQEVTPTTSFTQPDRGTERASKKPRNQGGVGRQR